MIAYSGPAALRSRCATCFGPLRSPDGAYGPSSAPSAPAPTFGGSAGPIVTVAAEDPTGATELKPGLLWIRLPRPSAP
jgi:hypothetical protein